MTTTVTRNSITPSLKTRQHLHRGQDGYFVLWCSPMYLDLHRIDSHSLALCFTYSPAYRVDYGMLALLRSFPLQLFVHTFLPSFALAISGFFAYSCFVFLPAHRHFQFWPYFTISPILCRSFCICTFHIPLRLALSLSSCICCPYFRILAMPHFAFCTYISWLADLPRPSVAV